MSVMVYQKRKNNYPLPFFHLISEILKKVIMREYRSFGFLC